MEDDNNEYYIVTQKKGLLVTGGVMDSEQGNPKLSSPKPNADLL